MSRNKNIFSLFIDFKKLDNNEFQSNSFESENKILENAINSENITKITELEILNSPRTISFR